MKLIYTPDGGEPQAFSITPGLLRSVDAEAVEEVGGTAWETFSEWDAQFRRGRKRAERAGLWICLRRDNPGLEFHQVDFAAGEIWVGYEDSEKRTMRANVRANTELTDDAKTRLLEAIGDPEGEEDVTPLEPSDSPGEPPDSPPDDASTGGQSEPS